MTTKEAFKDLCKQRGVLTKIIAQTECKKPGVRAAEIRWRIKHKSMWPREATMFRYLILAGWKNTNGDWETSL